MIKLQNLSFTHDREESPTLKHLNLEYRPGEFALICGPTGAGKSTLLQALNGLAPHFTPGVLSGKIFINGEDFTNRLPHEFAQSVGYVTQQAENSFVADRVDEEIAFGMEQLGFAPEVMANRIRDIARLIEIEEILQEQLTELSGGQQQRVAIAAALAAGQKVLLLDEPTSELDVSSAHKLLENLRDLTRKASLTILIAEHRIERALDLVDSVTVVSEDGSVNKAEGENLDALLQNYRMVPPVVELGQALKLKPLPLTVEQARKFKLKFSRIEKPQVERSEILSTEPITVRYGEKVAVHQARVALRKNQITAILGANGSGKSSLLWAIQQKHAVTLLPQTASDLLMFSTVREELEDSDRESQVEPGTTARMLEKLSQRLDPNKHPRDLSAGQQLSLVLAIQLTRSTEVLLLDEPTRGLDYESKRHLAEQLKELKKDRAILLASHDVEFLALVADEILEMHNGILSASKTVEESLSALAELAPQIWQVSKTVLNVDDALASVVSQ